MASLIHELENNEALLLMYATDELPAEDRADVEQMLVNDAGLRAELERIRLAYDISMSALATMDKNVAALPSENFAVRQACRAMKQWHVDQLLRIPVEAPVARRKIPVWAYPAATAAMLVIGGLMWWGNQGDPIPEALHPNTANLEADTQQVQSSLENDIPTGIAEAQTKADTLADRSDDSSVASSIFLLDGNQ
jgi:hypothetical protein